MKILKNKIVVMTFSLLLFLNLNAFAQQVNYDTLLSNVVDYVIKDRNVRYSFFNKCHYDTTNSFTPHFNVDDDLMIGFFIDDLANEALEAEISKSKVTLDSASYQLLKAKYIDSVIFFSRNYYEIISQHQNIPHLFREVKKSLKEIPIGEQPNARFIFSIPYKNYIALTIYPNRDIVEPYCNMALVMLLKYSDNGQILKAFYNSYYFP